MSPTSYQAALPRDIKLVPETGVEPARDRSHGILSPGRLPIPPLRHLPFQSSVLFGAQLEYHSQSLLSTIIFKKPPDRNRTHLSLPPAYTDMYTTYEGGIPMQHTQQDETILRTEPKEDIDDLIFRADPGWMVSER